VRPLPDRRRGRRRGRRRRRRRRKSMRASADARAGGSYSEAVVMPAWIQLLSSPLVRRFWPTTPPGSSSDRRSMR